MFSTYGDDDFEEELASECLGIGAIKLNPSQPFTWASGYRMPIYNDNRMLLGYPDLRGEISMAIRDLIGDEMANCDVIAGTSTAGIPWASYVSYMEDMPMIYVRDKPKDHGLRNQIEGIDAAENLNGKKVVLIEDLVSTGGSSVKAVQAIRDANGKIDCCVSIFSYGFDEAERMFRGELPYDKESGKKLTTPCGLFPLLRYDVLIDTASKYGKIKKEDVSMLKEWRADPFNWGEKHGFPQVKKEGSK